MFLSVEEFDESLTRVEWETELYVNENSRRRCFRLGDFHPGAPTLELVCFYCVDEYSVNVDSTDSRLTKLSFGVGVIGKYGLLCAHNSSEENQNDRNPPLCCNRPSKIWARVNKLSTEHLMKRLNASKWITELSDFWLRPRSNRNRNDRSTFPVTFTVWMRFEAIPQNSLNALNQLSNMFIKQSKCDVYFLFENDEKIGAHIPILTAGSPVFCAMFEHEMTESITRKVNIQDIQVDIFRQLLHYIYTGQPLQPITENSAPYLYVAADKYQIDGLKEECVRFLLCCIRIDNALDLMAWAHIHLIEEVVEETLIFAARFSHDICYHDSWERLIRNHPDLCVIATRRMLKPTFFCS